LIICGIEVKLIFTNYSISNVQEKRDK